MIIIDNLPIVNREKGTKLKNILMKIYGAICEDVKVEDLHFPFDETSGLSPG
jgi:hypothetical protein